MTEEIVNEEVVVPVEVVSPVVEAVVEKEVVPVHKGLDVGTNLIVAGSMDASGSSTFSMERDAYYRIKPESEVNSNSVKMSLDRRGANYIIDSDGSYIVIGDDALEIAIERRGVAERPLSQGVISPKSKRSLPIIKLIIKSLLGEAVKGSKVVFSVPGKPIDENFDIVYHKEILSSYLESLGYEVDAINETFAVALSELLDDGLTGITISLGAGMTNILVIHEGSPILEFSVTRSGDYIDASVGRALDMSPSLVLQEKESGIDLYNPKGEIQDAIAVYFDSVIKYIIKNIAFELEKHKKEIPMFKDGVPIIISGGLTLAGGFLNKFEEQLNKIDFPVKISEVRVAKNPMTACSNGCLLAAML